MNAIPVYVTGTYRNPPRISRSATAAAVRPLILTPWKSRSLEEELDESYLRINFVLGLTP
jgi:hypothetical protein